MTYFVCYEFSSHHFNLPVLCKIEHNKVIPLKRLEMEYPYKNMVFVLVSKFDDIVKTNLKPIFKGEYLLYAIKPLERKYFMFGLPSELSNKPYLLANPPYGTLATLWIGEIVSKEEAIKFMKENEALLLWEVI
jgi:hypothetical protein